MTVSLGRMNVSRETIERLEIYASLLTKWNQKINLVSRESLKDLWERHFVDSSQLFHVCPQGGAWLDMGSGGGFPGLVVAILAKGAGSAAEVTLIESDQRKAAFLRSVARETGVTCRIIASRIEAAPPQKAQTVSARALTDLSNLLGFTERHLAPEGTALFPKGRNWKKEVQSASGEWQFDFVPITSWTDPEAAILQIKGVARV